MGTKSNGCFEYAHSPELMKPSQDKLLRESADNENISGCIIRLQPLVRSGLSFVNYINSTKVLGILVFENVMVRNQNL